MEEDWNIIEEKNGKEKEKEKKEIKEKLLSDKSDKMVLWAVIALVIISLAFLIPRFIPAREYSETLDKLHELNLKGKLKEGNGYIYNGYSFVFYDGLWYTQVQAGSRLYDVPLRYAPRELEDVNITGKLNKSFYDRNEWYVTFDPYGEDLQYIGIAVGEFESSIIRTFGKKPVAACIKEHPQCAGRAILDCNNKSASIIYFKNAEDTAIVLDGDCMTLQSREFGIVKAVDRVLMQFYNIME